MVSEDTRHQNVSVPGPVTVVCIQLSPLWVMVPLTAASTPSCVVAVWLVQSASPPVVHGHWAASTASPRVGPVAVPACRTVQVREMPPPATTMVPVRDPAEGFEATPNVTVPFPLPEAPAAIASQGALVTAVHATLPNTAIDRPLDAAKGMFVPVGEIVSEFPPIWNDTEAVAAAPVLSGTVTGVSAES